MNNIHRIIFRSLGLIGAGSGLFSFASADFKTTASELAELISAVFAGLNILAIIWFTWTKNRGEVKKLEAEGESEIVEATHSNLEGAKLVTTMLKEQIDELRKELEREKIRREEDAKRFEQRIREIEAELRNYRSYASRLAAQVIEAGKIPEPLIFDRDDEDSLLENLDKQQKKIEQIKGKRKEEIKNAKDGS